MNSTAVDIERIVREVLRRLSAFVRDSTEKEGDNKNDVTNVYFITPCVVAVINPAVKSSLWLFKKR